ncbi:DUF4189 domain-containing protein [Achromobacter xylosoxidans]|uniref:DUF4189 domain-containing protein n=1 Tax=Alcaligenes xylosoxydans xylosoxydans TaxID=85698 RepID=UPI001EEF655C|nr:DUF4189 domain-containing protein [Achromobacter xylosoxidans]
MRTLIIASFLIALNFTHAGVAQAQQDCPEGFARNAAGAPGQQCVPVPVEIRPAAGAPSTPAAGAAQRWGAVAYDALSGSIGISADRASKARAEKDALAQCATKGGARCVINTTYHDQCVAVAYGPSPKGSGVMVNSVTAAGEELARMRALETCEKDTGASCQAFYTGCSLPVPAQ